MKRTKIIFLFLILSGFCFFAGNVWAKSYYYEDYKVDIQINRDSTFDVIETATYNLDGSFGFFTRDVALKDIDLITDVEVFDGDRNRIPKSELDIKSRNNEKHIQWNFARRNFSNEEKSWTVKYKVHGGISFLKNYDEIYWNAIPSDRSALIENVKVTVSLPNREKFRSDLIHLYSENIPETLARENCYFENENTKAVFVGKNLEPNTNFTIAAGFPKGIVSQSAYWKDFFKIYYGYILSIIIFLSSVIIGFVYWYRTEKSKERKRSIVPRYEPPQNLRPAMAEIITKEKLTNKGLAATIVDLAVRGYVKITKEKRTKFEFEILSCLLLAALIYIIIIGFFVFSSLEKPPLVVLVVFVSLFALVFLVFLKNEKYSDYTVTKAKPYENDPNLEDYEKKYLKALFHFRDYFSTKELRKNRKKSMELYKKIQKVKDEIYKETELDTGAFEIGLTVEKKEKSIWSVLVIGILFLFAFSVAVGQFFVLALTTIVSIVGLWAFIKYDARLSEKGIILKEDWLGFKMYLETAEKYRMQNLKPEFFEKYLPYAMIFDVEEKWAKAFETMHLPQPTWYAGSAYAPGSASNSAGSFSPLSFSKSFSSSFTSAFSSSGAGGASGGGGGAGGGGGGGGGGAG